MNELISLEKIAQVAENEDVDSISSRIMKHGVQHGTG